MQKICRLCLKRTDQNQTMSITNEHLRQIRSIIPEVNLKTIEAPLVCMDCTKSLKIAHDFKSICLETEKRLESYIKLNGMVNLEELSNVVCDKNKRKDDNFISDEMIDIKREENIESEEEEDLTSITDDINDINVINDLNTRNIMNSNKLILVKSQHLYERQYTNFIKWCETQDVKIYSENVFLTYFNKKAKTQKASTLWSTYSMLKSMFITKHNINIAAYSKLTTLIKQLNRGYTPKQSNVFTRKQVCKFIEEAPDHKYLLWKVFLIFGIVGSCRTCELKNMMTYHIEDKGTALVITIPDTKTGKSIKSRTFTILERMFNHTIKPIDIYRKYLSLRPSHITHDYFFIFYANSKCSTQVIGIHTIGKIPTKIASHLKIRDASNYTGHAFRRTSAALLAHSSLEAEEDEPDSTQIIIKREILI